MRDPGEAKELGEGRDVLCIVSLSLLFFFFRVCTYLLRSSDLLW